jgi:predicted MFS family arabinose efflux permease
VNTVGLAPGAVGGLVAATGTGGIVGALRSRRVAARIGTARALLPFEMGFAVVALLTPATFDGAGLTLFVAGGFCVTAGVVAGNIVTSSFKQRYCPPHILGRATASSAFLNYGTIPLGALAAGWLGTVLGLRTAMWVTTAGIPLAALTLVFSPIRHVRDLPTTPEPGRRPLGSAARVEQAGDRG